MEFNKTGPCGGAPTCGPTSLLRSGKDAMPFRGGAVLTTYMGDFIPPVLMPGYSGHLPGVSQCSGSTYGDCTKRHFQTFRHEILTQQVRPKFFYGRLPCDFSPFPDVVMAQKALDWARLAPSKADTLRPTNVDPATSDRLHALHARCVNQREYYLDKYDKLSSDPFFNVGRPYPIRCPADERVFKIRRPEDSCDSPGFIGDGHRCNAMPCIAHHGMMYPVEIPRLPRPPFQCHEVKRVDPNQHEVLLV